MDDCDDVAWLQALDEDAGLNAQVDHLQNSCTFHVDNQSKSSVHWGRETDDGD